jgi:hypothetical protein
MLHITDLILQVINTDEWMVLLLSMSHDVLHVLRDLYASFSLLW